MITKKIAFDEDKYIQLQVNEIKKRIKNFDKVYIEFGGHLLRDYHANRVLIDYKKDTKVKILEKIKKDVGIIYCIYSKHLENGRDYNSNLEFRKLVLEEIEKLHKKFEKIDIVITRYKNENSGKVLEKEMKKKNIKVYFSKTIKDYPNDLDEILGQKGFIEQPYIQTNKKINVVIGAVANSGKMGICLAQIFLDSKNKINSGYFKSETFPVFNLPLNHPINLAYEAATADIGDKNIIDPYHKKAYGITAINYNRDIENFKILKKIINKIISKKNKMHEYKSPTDMGINTVKSSIINEEKIKEAARKEIIKRHKKYIEKKEKREVIERMEKILKKIIP
ncbi:DUF1846 family protein [archaeon]|nr:DUF1846 family protein [archaeon]NCP79630.1 DUF1846 family protein [archaeon]NCP98299.1 DUF1846 family protein [archaeon]NCQ07397.1 DUF1846 family protein [archaeon]NCQ51193.1 DUF1846 family protein [archaeon]